MNIAQAYQLLEIPESISDEDLKKTFRKQAAKYHPDVNKDPGSEQKSKEISEAFNLIKAHRENPPPSNPFQGGFNPFQSWNQQPINIQDFFGFANQVPELRLQTSVSFAESILGIYKEISYQRDTACAPCKGRGFLTESSCAGCQGKGFLEQIIERKIGTRTQKIIQRHPCFQCRGQGGTKVQCLTCAGTKHSSAEHKLKIKIPPGISSGQILRLQNQGHHLEEDDYAPALLEITVIPEKNMALSGNDVISSIEISLLEALTGTNKEVSTVTGPETISIPAKIRHSERVNLPNKGVNLQGNHIFEVKVSYPDNVESVISALS